MRKTTLCVAMLVAQAISAAPAFAQASDTEVRELRAMVEQLQKKIEEIEAAQKAGASAVASSATPAAPATASTPAPATAARPGNLLPEGLTIYGTLDSGVENVTNVGPGEGTVTRVPSTTGSVPSNVGLDLRRSVDDSIAVVGKAEMGIYLDSGSSGQGSRLFGRQIYIGLDSRRFGSVTFGRQYSMLLYALGGGDILGPNIQGIGSFDAYIPNARHDNSVVWRTKFDKLSLGAHYSFGRDASTTSSVSVPGSGICGGEDPGDASRCRSWSAMAKYDDPRFGVAVAIDNQNGGSATTQANLFNGASLIPMPSSSDEDRRITANGYVRFGALKLAGGWLGRKVSTTSRDVTQDMTWLQGEYAITPKVVVDGGFFHVENDDQDTKANLYVIRGSYRFDDRLSTYLSLGWVDNGEDAAYGVSTGGGGVSPAPGNSQLGSMVGVRYRF
jgi:predicted porin